MSDSRSALVILFDNLISCYDRVLSENENLSKEFLRYVNRRKSTVLTLENEHNAFAAVLNQVRRTLCNNDARCIIPEDLRNQLIEITSNNGYCESIHQRKRTTSLTPTPESERQVKIESEEEQSDRFITRNNDLENDSSKIGIECVSCGEEIKLMAALNCVRCNSSSISHPTVATNHSHATSSEETTLETLNNTSAEKTIRKTRKIKKPEKKTASENVIKTSKGIRKRWSESQKEIMKKYFEKFITQKKVPSKPKCKEFLERYSEQFDINDWSRVKTFVFNTYYF